MDRVFHKAISFPTRSGGTLSANALCVVDGEHLARCHELISPADWNVDDSRFVNDADYHCKNVLAMISDPESTVPEALLEVEPELANEQVNLCHNWTSDGWIEIALDEIGKHGPYYDATLEHYVPPHWNRGGWAFAYPSEAAAVVVAQEDIASDESGVDEEVIYQVLMAELALLVFG